MRAAGISTAAKLANSKPKPLFHWLLLLLLLPAIFPAKAQHYTFSRFGQSEGLLNQDVSSIVQDRRGVLWVGTENGLFEADGNRFVRLESYTDAAYGAVLGLNVDSAGRVWVLGAKRLVFIDTSEGLQGRLHTVQGLDLKLLFNEGVALASLPQYPDTVFLLWNGGLDTLHSDDKGATWRLTQTLDNQTLAEHPQLKELKSLTADPGRGQLWAACGENVCQISMQQSKTGGSGRPAVIWNSALGVPGNTWSALTVASNGDLLAGGIADVLRLHPGAGKVEDLGDPSGGTPAKTPVTLLVEAPTGTVLANSSARPFCPSATILEEIELGARAATKRNRRCVFR